MSVDSFAGLRTEFVASERAEAAARRAVGARKRFDGTPSAARGKPVPRAERRPVPGSGCGALLCRPRRRAVSARPGADSVGGRSGRPHLRCAPHAPELRPRRRYRGAGARSSGGSRLSRPSTFAPRVTSPYSSTATRPASASSVRRGGNTRTADRPRIDRGSFRESRRPRAVVSEANFPAGTPSEVRGAEMVWARFRPNREGYSRRLGKSPDR